MNEKDEISADRRKIANVILNRVWLIKKKKNNSNKSTN
jgi:hypothetical protein